MKINANKALHRTLIDPVSATSLRVVPKFNSVPLASATAFTLEWMGTPYLITNWHVVSGRDADTGECLDKTNAAIPNVLSVNFHKKGTLGEWSIVEIPLHTPEGNQCWIEHPLGREIDVVAVPLPLNIYTDVELYPLDLALARTDILAMPAMPISVIGYPLGLSTGGSWPIWKTGHIASDPDLDFESGRPAFLIDATTRSGMSGSPVLLRIGSYTKGDGSQVIAGGIATKFMGVYAGRIHGDSEIGRVWRPFLLTELFERRLTFNEDSRRVRPGRLVACPCNSGRRFKSCCGSAA